MINLNTKKYIIASVVILVLLITIYIALLLKNRHTPTTINTDKIATPTNQQTFVLPSSTPAPTAQITKSTDPEIIQNESPVDQKFLDRMRQDEILERPDVVVSNSVPYNNDYFYATTEFVQAEPTGFHKIIIYKNVSDDLVIDAEIKKWLKSLGLPDESINKLIIEKRPIAQEL